MTIYTLRNVPFVSGETRQETDTDVVIESGMTGVYDTRSVLITERHE